jgi:hypothetical protein
VGAIEYDPSREDMPNKPKKSKIRWAHRDHTGWWIFCEVEQWVSNRQKKLKPTSRCAVY